MTRAYTPQTVVTLYRCPTPTDRLCPCGRVARELGGAGIEHEVVRVPYRRSRRPAVEQLTGQRRVPVLVLEDGDAICDSHRIVERLRDERAAGASARAAAR